MIILEGIDGVGKTTVADYLNKDGYVTYHFPFDEKNRDIEEKYLSVLNKDTKKMVLDRCFISELVYGPILRGYSRLSKNQLENILNMYKTVEPVVVYLKANRDDILERRKDDNLDYSIISNYYNALNERYDKTFRVISQYLDVIRINTSEKCKYEVFSFIEEKINGHNLCREYFQR